jgi:cyclase
VAAAGFGYIYSISRSKEKAMKTPLAAVMRSIVLVLSLSGIALAQAAQPSQGPLVQKIRGNVYFVRGGMAYGGFSIYDKGVVVIDAKMTAEGTKQVVAEIAKITPLPITHILLTHSDGDHVNGLTGYPTGLAILSSETTKREMEEAFKDEKMAPLRAYLPTRTFTRPFSLDLGAASVELIPVGPAHTGGDTFIYFRDEKTAFVGDLAFLGRDPLIHRQKGGTSEGYAQALRTMLSLGAETYLSGHNEPMTAADLRGILASIEEKRAKVGALVKEGKTLDEIKKAMGVSDASAGSGGFRWPSIVEIIYQELTEKK